MTIAAERFPGAVRERLREFRIALETESPDAPRLVPHVDADIDAIVTLSRTEAKARYAVPP